MRDPASGRAAWPGGRLALVLVLAVAAALRLYGITWDGGMLFHPDERHILVVVNRIAFPWPPDWGLLLSPESPWNPQFFAYGSLPIYLLRIAANLAGQLDPSYAGLQSSYLVGRMLSAFFDLATVALVFRLGYRLFDERVGLLAAALTAVTVLHVQLAHFYAVDTLLAFFVLLTVDLAIDLAGRPTPWRGVGVGIAWGAALATKVSAAPLGLVVVVAWVLGTLAARSERPLRSERGEEPCKSASRPLARARGDGAPPSRRRGAQPHASRTLAEARGDGAPPSRRQPREPMALAGARGGGLDRESAEGAKGAKGGTAECGHAQPGGRNEPGAAGPAFTPSARAHVSVVRTLLPESRTGAAADRGRGKTEGGEASARIRAWTRPVVGVMVTGLIALLTFALLEPYAVIDPVTFAGDVVHESRMARGIQDIPYTRQFIGTLPYVYPIQQAIVWSMGIPLGVAGFVAMLAAVARGGVAVAARSWRRAADLIVPLAWVLPYLGIIGSFHAKFLRYLLPILPFLSLWAAWMLVDMVRAGRRLPWRIVGWGALAVVVGGSTLYALAYLNVYTETHPWIQTTAWLCENLPPGSRIAIEHWDDPLPLPQATGQLRCYRRHNLTQLPMYNRDDEAKLEVLLAGLEDNDYIVLASNRLYNAIPRLPSRYPLTSRYYHLLMGEELGFELVHTAATYPRLFGVDLVHDTFHDPDLPKPALLRAVEAGRRSLVLGRADESYSVYDHPMTLVFKKVEPLSREEMMRRFGGVAYTLTPAADG